MNSQSAKFIITIVATVSAGIPVWTISSRNLNLTDPSLFGILLLIGIAVTVIANLFFNLKPGDLIGAVTAGFALAVIIRFLADMFFGTSNLSMIGIQLIIATAIGAISAWMVTFAMGFKNEKQTVKRK
jgi:hypothetical protein